MGERLFSPEHRRAIEGGGLIGGFELPIARLAYVSGFSGFSELTYSNMVHVHCEQTLERCEHTP